MENEERRESGIIEQAWLEGYEDGWNNNVVTKRWNHHVLAIAYTYGFETGGKDREDYDRKQAEEDG